MSVLIDKYGRALNYLRLSVTDQCNLRCYYCMPEDGIAFARKQELLSFEEMELLMGVFTRLGVRKLRLTGGEPFVRKDIMSFIERISKTNSLDEITLTTNGTLLAPHLSKLKELGIHKINLSLDSLNRERFFRISRRDCFESVMNVLQQMLHDSFEVKLNCVVMAGKNIEDILPFIALTKDQNVSVRFLEEMPFNGGDHEEVATWNYLEILEHIRKAHPEIETLASEPTSTSVNYRIPGHQGSFGIIPSFSRTFCGTCNRLRLSATGELRTCLYGPPVANLRDLLRAGANERELEQAIINAVAGRARDGFAAEAENAATHHSMTLLGG
jgi:cyclic pyranopterin phosphate synthase